MHAHTFSGENDLTMNISLEHLPLLVLPFLREDRSSKTGGGVAVLCRSSLKPKLIQTEQHSTFEHIAISLSSDKSALRLVSLYRPPSSPTPLFLEQFSNFLEQMCLGGSDIVIAGDLNIKWDEPENSFTRRYSELLTAFGLSQNVKDPTHVKSHILDHIISRDTDNLKLSNTRIGDLVSDHYLVYTCISATLPLIENEQMCYRKIKDIDMQSFQNDLKSTHVFNNYEDCDLDTLVRAYDADLRAILDKHAPLIKRRRTLPKREPWYTGEIHSIRRTVRAKERRYHKSRSSVDLAVFQQARSHYKSVCKESKASFYNDLINRNAKDQGQVFKVANRIMKRQSDNPLPESTSAKALADQFGNHFTDKINRIRSEFDSCDDPFEYDSAFTGTPLSEFEPISVEDTIKLISKATPKSCELDPIPSSLVKMLKELLSPIICRIINLSITQGQVPDIHKTALVRPLLKKTVSRKNS